MKESYIKDKIESAVPGSSVDITGDGVHFEAVIISESFEGLSTLDRHKIADRIGAWDILFNQL